MPWTEASAQEHTRKANTPAKRKRWAAIANAALETYKGDEGKAIASANAAMHDSFWQGRLFDRTAFAESQRRPRIRTWRDGFPAKWDREARIAAAERGEAMPDGNYPINDKRSLKLAISNTKDSPAVIHHIKSRAKALDLTDMLPDKWGSIQPSIVAERKVTVNKDKQQQLRAALDADRSKCPECDGRGWVHGKQCEACDGDGFIDDEEKMRRQSMSGGFGGNGGNNNGGDKNKNAADKALADKRAELRTKLADHVTIEHRGKHTDLDDFLATITKVEDADKVLALAIEDQVKAFESFKDTRQTCPDCDGSGEDDNGEDCQTCGGSGFIDWDGDTADARRNKWVTRDPAGRETGSGEEEFEDAIHLRDDGMFRGYETVNLTDANIRYTKDGYMMATPLTARTGIQLYRGSDCGKPDMEFVRVFRPAEEVFSKDALRSYTHKPLTLDHPDEDVTAANWKQYATGYTGDEILRDGERFRVPLMMADAAAIQAFKDGTNQLSWGYNCALDWTPGETADGKKYDAIQRHLRANHLAVVASARGGPELRIGDTNVTRSAKENHTMSALKTLTIDGFDVQLDAQSEMIIKRTIKSLEDQVENFKKKAKEKEDEDEDRDTEDSKKDAAIKAKDATIAEKDKALAAKDAELATVKQQLKDAQDAISPSELDKRVLDRLDVIRKAKLILGDKFAVDGKSVPDIRRMVVDAKLKDGAKGWTDDMIAASFNTLQAPVMTAGGEGRTPIDDAVAVFGRPGTGYTSLADERQKAYDKYDQDLQNAWRREGAQH